MSRVIAGLLCIVAAQAQTGQPAPAANSAGYVNSSICATCHAAIAESYARTGMGRSFRIVAANAVVPAGFQGQTFRHEASDQNFVTSIKGNKPYLRRYQQAPDGSTINELEMTADYAIGSGNHALTYLHRTPAGKLIELPLTWYTEEGGYWNMSPAYDRPDHPGFSREITYRCMFCHNAYPDVPARADQWDGATFPGALPEGIDCQRCHGPGRNHVEAARQGGLKAERIRSAIVNPARLNLERQTEVCMQCHLETTSSALPAARLREGRGVFSYRPGEPLADYTLHFDHAPGAGHDDKFEIVNAAYGLRKSRCSQATQGRLTCTTCHDPHQASSGAEAEARYALVCQSCHAGPIAGHRDPALTTASASVTCVSCHMPRRRPSDVIHAVMTDHQIRKLRPGTAPAVEVNSANTMPYRGPVVLYYPPSLPPTPDNHLDIAIAQIADGSNLQPGLARAEALLEMPKRAGVRTGAFFELGQAWFRSGDARRALRYLETARQHSPDNWRYLYATALAAAAAAEPGLAQRHLERAQGLAPAEAVVLTALADLDFGRGRFREAIAQLQRAIAIDPALAESHHNLGNALLQSGDLRGASAAYAEAVRLRPEVAAFHESMARLLMRQGEMRMARYHLECAVRISVPLGQANRDTLLANRQIILGAVMQAMGDVAGAIGKYRAAVEANRNSAEAYLNLGLALAAARQAAPAQQSLETALTLDPSLFIAQLKLGEILLGQGQRAAARERLLKASQSPEPAIRAEAARLLLRAASN